MQRLAIQFILQVQLFAGFDRARCFFSILYIDPFGLRQIINDKKRSERRKHCALAVVRRSQKKFAPPQTPFPGRSTVKI